MVSLSVGDGMKEELLKEIKQQIESTNVDNVGIFVDYDNIYYGLKDFGINVNDANYCVFSIMNDVYGKEKIRTMRAYADFDQVDVSLRKLQEKRVQIKNVYGNGKEEKHRKNASDIELCIDAIETYYKNSNIDTYVFITADSDMIPIMSRLTYKGKKVHLYYIEDNTSQYQDITNYSDVKCDLLTLFEIDKERKNPSYWVEQAKTAMENWYSDTKNTNKTLGGKWLKDLFKDNFSLSDSFASTLIAYMEQCELFEKDELEGKTKIYRIKK